MSETRKIAAIMVADVVGYSRLVGADEDGTLARLRALRSDVIDPTIAVHHGRVVKRTGDAALHFDGAAQKRHSGDVDAWDVLMRALSHYWLMTNEESEIALEML